MLRKDIDQIGERERGPPTEVAGYFHKCPICGQPVDRRDLGAVFHHEAKQHDPLPYEEAFRLVLADERLAAAISQPD